VAMSQYHKDDSIVPRAPIQERPGDDTSVANKDKRQDRIQQCPQRLSRHLCDGDVDGRNQRQLTFGAKNPADGSTRTYTSGPVWSPDGTKIAFTGNLDYRSFDLNVMNADGTRINRITNGIDVDTATWSPDGKKLAFSNACGSIEGLCPIDIYTVNADGTGLNNLTINPHGAQDVGPAWSPDGSSVHWRWHSPDSAASPPPALGFAVSRTLRGWCGSTALPRSETFLTQRRERRGLFLSGSDPAL